MKKSRILLALTALILSLAVILCSCADKPAVNKENSETTSDVSSQETTEDITLPPSKYGPEDKLIALTFDDGPSIRATNKILDVLEKNESQATFFLVGYNIEKYISTVKRAQGLGCEIGNHSKDHKNLMKCDIKEIRAQVDTPNNKLKSLTGVSPILFRAPGGNFDGVEKDIGMPLIQWSIDTEDWKYKDASNKDRSDKQREADLKKITDRVIAEAGKGDIILMHDIYDFTADLCEQLIPALIEKGFKLVTVSEMYNAYGVKLEDGKVYHNIDVIVADAVPLEAGNYIVKTNGGVLNLRKDADSHTDSLARIPNQTPVKVVKSVPGWAYVEYEGISGWVNASFLAKA